MSKARHPYQAYAAAAQTVATTKQIVLLYDGMIRFMRQAQEAIRERRIEDRYHLLVRVSTIVEGLQSCLDFEKGAEVARVLYGFYSSIDGRVFSLHRDPSLSVCESVIADLKQMRDVWEEIDRNAAVPRLAAVSSDASEAGGKTISA